MGKGGHEPGNMGSLQKPKKETYSSLEPRKGNLALIVP
jgi:hypothetical protein